MNTTTKVIGGFLAGALFGVSIGLLMAPQKGSRSRQQIKKNASKIQDDLSKTIQKKLQSFKNQYAEKLEVYAEEGKSAAAKMKKNIQG